jgi:plastocyanin
MDTSPSPQTQTTPAPVAIPTTTVKSTAAPAPSKPETIKVTIKSFKFSPSEVTIKKGTTVVFENEDSVTHTATGASSFDTGDIKAGSSKSVTFDQAGTYDYNCTPHEFMTAKIIVTE